MILLDLFNCNQGKAMYGVEKVAEFQKICF